MDQDDAKTSAPDATGRRRRLLGLTVTGAAIALGVVHAIWPHLKIDSVTLALLVIALLPWIGGLVENIELPGGFKVGLREAERAAAIARARADNAASTADAALSAATTRVAQPVAELADEYARMRREVPPGPQRTSALDRLVGRLAVATADDAGFDFDAEITSTHPGHRLAALAYAYARPRPDMARAIIDAADTPASSFEQFWALRALAQVASTGPEVEPATMEKLRALAEQIHPDSGRGYEMKRLLRAYPGLADYGSEG